MELDYNIIGCYSPDNKKQTIAEMKIQILIDDNFLMEKEVIEIASAYDTVIAVEVEQDDGYCETILVDNKGKVRIREIFDLDNVAKEKIKIEEEGIENYFCDKKLKIIESFAKEYDMTIEEFQKELISEFFFDEYEQAKTKLKDQLKKYYS